METWKDVAGWEGEYQVSDRGRVRSVDRETTCLDRTGRMGVRRHKGRVLKGNENPVNGYAHVALVRPGTRTVAYVHRLVAETFLGTPPAGQEVRHRNGIRLDCALSNLQYGTRSENALDRHEHGTMNPLLGEDTVQAKLTEEKVRDIRRREGTHRQLGEEYGVSHSVIGHVKRGTAWRHVT